MDTQLGYWFDEGKQISFGEWQKLAIARTFSKDADVIFLDEPNSALDAISDYEISQLYQKLFQDKMGIIIAHKFNNLINQVNNILVIENGVWRKVVLTQNFFIKGRFIMKCTSYKIKIALFFEPN